MEFPNNGSPSLAVSNGDGTFNILINTLFCEAKQRESLRHEVEHLTEEHFFRDDLSITQIEHVGTCTGLALLGTCLLIELFADCIERLR